MRNDRPKRRRFDAVAWSVGAMTAAALAVDAAHAESKQFRLDHARYVEECGSCHVAYPPPLLSAESWRAVMNGLDRHFGTDASIDSAARADIAAYLAANAGAQRKFGATATRITETRWFAREHDEVPAHVWQRADVKSAANCGACHTQADRGDYSERSLRVPRR
ncbi:MAG: diheme cytochrome c [Pseudomonadota bacterium]